jgi:hypothetical protein
VLWCCVCYLTVPYYTYYEGTKGHNKSGKKQCICWFNYLMTYMLVWCHHSVTTVWCHHSVTTVWCHHSVTTVSKVSFFCIVLTAVCICGLLILPVVLCKLAGDLWVINLRLGLFGLNSLLHWDPTWAHIWIWCRATCMDPVSQFKKILVHADCACRLCMQTVHVDSNNCSTKVK